MNKKEGETMETRQAEEARCIVDSGIVTYDMAEGYDGFTRDTWTYMEPQHLPEWPGDFVRFDDYFHLWNELREREATIREQEKEITVLNRALGLRAY